MHGHMPYSSWSLSQFSYKGNRELRKYSIALGNKIAGQKSQLAIPTGNLKVLCKLETNYAY